MSELDNINAVEARGVGYRAGGSEILKGVDLVVRQGEFFSIIGPNGAGKTSLLKCVDGLVRFTGRISVLGYPVAGTGRKELARVVSYVPQASSAVFPFTVREFVMMARYPHLSPFTSPGPEDEEAVEGALSATGTGRFSGRRMDTLSGGERQKVLLAASVAQGARVLLLDEPTTFLDPRHTGEITALLEKLNRETGVTVVFVTHDINLAVHASHRVGALKGGHFIWCGRPEGVMEENVLEELYERPFTFALNPATGRPVVVPGGSDGA